MAVFIVVIIVGAVGLIAAITALYLIIYRRYINRRLIEGRTAHGSMAAPIAVLITALVAVMASVILIISILVGLFMTKTEHYTVTAGTSVSDGGREIIYGGYTTVRPIHPDELNGSPFEGYTAGSDIKGYTRYETTDGDIKFWYYKTNENMSGVMPRLLICPVCSCSDETEKILRFDLEMESIQLADDGAVLFAVGCDNYYGILEFSEYVFTKEQAEKINDPSEYSEEYLEQADIKGKLTIDLSYSPQ
ncbi:MAG: hypothetical protein ILP19_06020 [Oscillospiraceae bacterium]|nr:hypothetical protein [Oscillospiraceae bacterium]